MGGVDESTEGIRLFLPKSYLPRGMRAGGIGYKKEGSEWVAAVVKVVVERGRSADYITNIEYAGGKPKGGQGLEKHKV